MKNFKRVSLILFAVVTSEPHASDIYDVAWVAKLSTQRQCQGPSEQDSVRLGDAIYELEQDSQFTVQSAGLARLNDRMFCQACDCPAGIFFVAQVKPLSSQKTSLPSNWEVIHPETIGELDSSGKAAEFRILPESPMQ